MSEVILSPISMTFVNAPYSLPGSSPITGYSLEPNIGYMNGFPAAIIRGIGGGKIGNLSMVQFDENNYYQLNLETGSSNTSGPPILGDNFVFLPGIAPGKGVKWRLYHLFNNYLGVPYPVYPDGVSFAFAKINSSLTPLCFPEGGLSCDTTAGNPFIGINGKNLSSALVLASAAGCPTQNNWGASYVEVYSNGNGITDNSFSTSQGSGTGTMPIMAVDDLIRAFISNFSYNNFQCATKINDKYIAVLSGPLTSSANGRLFRIYKYKIVTHRFPFCANELSIEFSKVYEKDLFSLMPNKNSTYFYVGSLISNGIDTVTVSIGQDGNGPATEYLMVIKLPGPVFQPIIIPALTRQWYGWITPSKKIILAMNPADGPSVKVSTSTLTLSYSINSQSVNNVYNVHATNGLEIININRSF